METTVFYAGAGRAEIELPQELFPLEGFSAEQDMICARVLLLEAGIRAAIVSLEMTSLADDEILGFKKIVQGKTGVPIENIWVIPTHTFSVPHIRHENHLKTIAEIEKNQRLRTCFKAAVEKASEQAFIRLKPAEMAVTETTCAVNVNRDVETADGWWLGRNEAGPSDKTVRIVSFRDFDKQLIAILFNYSVQSSVLEKLRQPDGSRCISGDLAGEAMRWLESAHGDMPAAIFALGAAGDQAPDEQAKQDSGMEGMGLAKQQGQTLGRSVEKALDQLTYHVPEAPLKIELIKLPLRQQAMPKSIKELQPTRTYYYEAAGEVDFSLEFLALGNLLLLGVRAELGTNTAQAILHEFPQLEMMVMTMVNGSAKYMPEKEAYAKFKYEAMNSPFAEGSAEALKETVIQVVAKKR